MNSVNADFRKNLISSWNYFSGRCWSYIYSFLDIYTTSYLWEPGIIKPCIFFRQSRSGFTVYTANSNPLWISKYIPRTYPPIETLQIMWWLFFTDYSLESVPQSYKYYLLELETDHVSQSVFEMCAARHIVLK